MGIVDTLTKIEKSKSLPQKYKTRVWEVISLLCTHPKVARKLLATNNDLFRDLKEKIA